MRREVRQEGSDLRFGGAEVRAWLQAVELNKADDPLPLRALGLNGGVEGVMEAECHTDFIKEVWLLTSLCVRHIKAPLSEG